MKKSAQEEKVSDNGSARRFFVLLIFRANTSKNKIYLFPRLGRLLLCLKC
jgi:hypothetical protein